MNDRDKWRERVKDIYASGTTWWYIYIYIYISARTYIQQLCEDTGCCPEDLPRAMNDREEWRERVRDIRATSARWWWWWYIYILHGISVTLGFMRIAICPMIAWNSVSQTAPCNIYIYIYSGKTKLLILKDNSDIDLSRMFVC